MAQEVLQRASVEFREESQFRKCSSEPPQSLERSHGSGHEDDVFRRVGLETK